VQFTWEELRDEMPKTRTMCLTADLVQLCHRDEIDPGPDPKRNSLTDEDFVALTDQLAGESGNEPLWVFAYGSLIWKPEFEFVEQRRATAMGWHRSFCLEIKSWRGSPEQAGLMMALERGGQCDGMIYRLPEGDRTAQIARLLRREISDHDHVKSVRWLPVKTADGPVRSLGFWVGPTGDRICPREPLPSVAATLARACGYVGSCAEYLYNTVTHLEHFGIHDRNLWRLQQLVAEEIREIHGIRQPSGAC